MIRSIVIFSLSLCAINASNPEKHALAPFFRLHHLDPPNYLGSRPAAEDQWFEQRLDHFNPLNPATYQQRYFSRYVYDGV